ncbi:MAG: hypothetical protein JW782_03550 [Candidatus Saganbacteria bacterium]|nr:hypothetical protein [Candidatus Saganbacteria bacterium]
MAAAMGGTPPKEEEPKYKLEILKMDIVPAQTSVMSTETGTASSEAKYKLEILKMDFISTPTSDEPQSSPASAD